MKDQKNHRKTSIKQVVPGDCIDAWKMFDKDAKSKKGLYPELDEVAPESLRLHLFNMISAQNALCVMMRCGRRPVGQVLASVIQYPFGRPAASLLIWSWWIEDEFKDQAPGMFKDLFARAKAAGVHHWEMNRFEGDAEPGITGARQLLTRYGGKIVFQ